MEEDGAPPMSALSLPADPTLQETAPGPDPEGAATTTSERPGSLRLLGRSLRDDAKAAPWRLWVNSLGGNPALPRVLRWAVYRTGGLDIRTANVYPGCTFVARHVSIGADTFVNRGCLFEGAGPLQIGRDCQIAMEAMFLTSTHPWLPEGGFARRPANLTTTVGDRCWVGARAIVLPGVTVGDDCVIAAGAVVAADCQPGGLYAGVPARRVRTISPRSDNQ
jgi:maltose O-acetyltransferase